MKTNHRAIHQIIIILCLTAALSAKTSSISTTAAFNDMVVFHILNMPQWSIEDIEKAILDYNIIEEQLILNLESRIIEHCSRIDIQNPQKFTSFIYKLIILYFYGAMDDGILNTTKGNNWYLAYSAFYEATNEASFTHLLHSTDNTLLQIPIDEAWKSLGEATKSLDINIYPELDYRYIQLANLFVLAYIAKTQYLELIFELDYKTDLSISDGDLIIAQSIDEATSIISELTQKNDDLVKNPYIISLRNIFKFLRPKHYKI